MVSPLCKPSVIITVRFFSSPIVTLRKVARCCSFSAGDERDYPVINQPLAGVTYTLRLSRDEETIPLQARVAADVQQVFWFADAVFIGTAKPQESLAWRPQQSGIYNAMAVDDHGRSVSRKLLVEFEP